MNAKKAKTLRKIAKSMATSTAEPVIQFFLERLENGDTKQSLVPTPMSWPKGTFRQIYQSLK